MGQRTGFWQRQRRSVAAVEVLAIASEPQVIGCRCQPLRRRARARALLAGCGALLVACTTATQAPIEQKSALPAAAHGQPGARMLPLGDAGATSPATHVVAAGETLHAIAWRYNLDYRDLIRWNQIGNPDLIRAGQSLRLRPPPAAAVTATALGSRAGAPPLQWQPLPSPAVAPAPTPTLAPTQASPPPGLSTANAAAAASVGARPPSTVPVNAAPLAALTPPARAGVTVKAPADSAVGALPPAAMVATPDAPAATAAGAGGPRWLWPTAGKVTPTESGGGGKGIDIRGTRGQPVTAAAAGTVVYSGSGLRGLGELIIIKHNDTFLSAYAHNEARLVQEGSHVNAGDTIARMGNSDSTDYMLHFEIRRNGKPVDPQQYLPAR